MAGYHIQRQRYVPFYDLVEKYVQLFGGRCAYGLEYWILIGDAIDSIEKIQQRHRLLPARSQRATSTDSQDRKSTYPRAND